MAAYLDEPVMAHFARELDEVAAEAAIADQGDGPVDVRVAQCAVAGGYGGDAAAVDAVTAWIAETIRRGNPEGQPPGRHPARARPPRPEPATRSAGWCADGSDDGDPRGRDQPAAATSRWASPRRAPRPDRWMENAIRYRADRTRRPAVAAARASDTGPHVQLPLGACIAPTRRCARRTGLQPRLTSAAAWTPA